MRWIILISVLFSGCAIKSVQQVCDERMAYGAYHSYADCYKQVSDARANVFKQAQTDINQMYAPKPKPVEVRTDYTCMNHCQSAGYQYQYCESRCSY